MPIYKITNKLNNDFYIGKTFKSIEARFAEHLHESTGLRSETHLHRAIRKYGKDAFCVGLLEDCDAMMLDEREVHWIATLTPRYNMTGGGEGGPTHHLDSWKLGMERRRSYVGSGNPAFGKGGMGGKVHDDTTKGKMSEARRRHWDSLTMDQRVNASAKLRGSSNGMFGKTPSNATGIEFNGTVYPSLSAAARATGHSPYFIKKHGKSL